MPWKIVRNLSPEIYRALRTRARRNGRSTDAELSMILHEALLPVSRIEFRPAPASPLEAFHRGGRKSDSETEPAASQYQ